MLHSSSNRRVYYTTYSCAAGTTCLDHYGTYVYSLKSCVCRYHDHGIDITSENAYSGLSGYLLVEETCPPYNLGSMERFALAIGDKVIDNNCQLRQDIDGAHADNTYGGKSNHQGLISEVTVLSCKVRAWHAVSVKKRLASSSAVHDLTNACAHGACCSALAEHCCFVCVWGISPPIYRHNHINHP